MQREPNPYSKNPMLTVTGTMAISVPSVVAEDVMNGEADKVINVDSEALNEIRADLAEVVEATTTAASDAKSAKQTALSAVQELTKFKQEVDSSSRLSYGVTDAYDNAVLLVGNTAPGAPRSGLNYITLSSSNGNAVRITEVDLQNLVNGNVGGGGGSGSGSASNIQTECLDYAQIRYDYSSDSLAIKANNDTGTGLNYYNLAAKGLVSSDYPNAQLRLYGNDSGVVELQLSGDYGRTWHNIVSEGSSSSGSSSDSSSGGSYVTYENLAQAQIRFDSNFGGVVAIQAADKEVNTGLAYYKIAAKGFVSSDWPNAQLRLYGGSNTVELQLSSDSGATWRSITSGGSDSTSSSGSSSGSSSDADILWSVGKAVYDLSEITGNTFSYAGYGNSDLQYKVIVPQLNDGSGDVYPIAVPGLVNPFSLKYGLFWRETSPYNYELCITDDAGDTWQPLAIKGSSSDSSAIEALYCNFSVENTVYPDARHVLDVDVSDHTMSLRAISGSDSVTYLDYGLRTALASFDVDSSCRLRIHNVSGNATIQLSNNYGIDWTNFGGACNFSVENTLYPDASHLLYVNTNTYSMRLYTDATSTASYLEYGLQTALAGFDEDSSCRLRVHQISGKAVIQLSNNLGIDWETVTDDDQSVTIDAALSDTSENPVQNKVVHAELAKKQDVLESGTTLKTINGISLLGGGDIQIGSDGGTSTTAEFVPVQYLGNTGTQYIDTGYVLQEDDILEVDYEIPESALSIKTDKILIDARDNSYGVRVSTYSGTYKWYARFGHNESQTSAALTSSLKGSLTLSKGQFILNGSVVFNSLKFSAMPTGTLKLLAGVNYETGAISAPSYARISACKIKRNGETIRNFRPVQRTADGELGMRDAVTGEFFTNAGTGVFDYLPSDVVEAGTVVKKPTLTEEQKLALQALMDDYYNNRNTFFYEFTHNRNAFTSGGQCYDSTKGKFKQCCATFVQHIMMGRSVNDFVGKTGSTYSPNITKTAVSDFGYYFDFKYRKYLYGLTDTDENGNEVYYGYNQPNADNFEGSYSYNSYYHPDSKNTNKQNFNGFCNANDMARELYEMGCEVPFAELDVGDIIFTLDNDLSDNSSMLNFHAWRNIYHVGMVYDVKQIDASSKEIYYIECTSYFDVDNRPIEKPFLSSSQMDLRFKAFKLTEDMAFCARMPIAFGYAPNVPSKITTSATPS